MPELKTSWSDFIRYAMIAYRQKHPEDSCSTEELLTSLHEQLVKSGLIRKVNGKYQVPAYIIGANPFLQ